MPTHSSCLPNRAAARSVLRLLAGTGLALLLASSAVADPAGLVAEANRLFGLARSELVRLDPGPDAGQQLHVPIRVNGVSDELILTRHSVRAAEHRILAQVADGSYVEVPAGPVRTYRGALRNMPGSLVAATLLETGLEARILLPNGEQLWIEPLQDRLAGALAGHHLVYRGGDILPGQGTCLALEAAALDDGAGAAADTGGADLAAATSLEVALLATDADYEYFQDWGSVDSVETRIESIINAINIQYERDVAITHQLGTMIVRQTAANPYTLTGPSELLEQFRDEWNQNHWRVSRDTAHLFTGKDLDGSTIGIAYRGVICSSTRFGFGYGLSQSDANNSFSYVSDLTAHEIGHNWNGAHCTCPDYTMNATVSGANQFNPVGTIPAITSFRDGLNCLDTVGLPAAPSGLVATAASSSAINLGWEDNANDETEFSIERSADGVTGWTEIATVSANITGYTDTNLGTCSQRSYRVRAFNDNGSSDYSNVATAQVLGSSEVCDGIDNDCDGIVDDGFPVGTPCTVGTGACQATGELVCTADASNTECNATPGTPAVNDTTCDGIDDDCDGAADEDYVSVPTSCGIGACESSGSTSCVGGAVEDSCTPGTPAVNDTTCDGVDDDCDGAADEDYLSVPTSCGIGACESTGTTACVDGTVGDSCTPGAPAAEDCDGVDNDCDGVVDEESCTLWQICGAVDLGDNWYWLEWLGYFNLGFDPWIYHQEHRFLYPYGEDCDTGLVVWDEAMNAFWWTSATVYPYVYRFSDSEWLWYAVGSVDPRWFVILSSGVWQEYW